MTKTKEIEKKKVQAYDLLRRVYAAVTELKELQQELAQVEAEIVELENADVQS